MKTNDKNKYKDFGDRLSLIMYKQNISNIQLANAIAVHDQRIPYRSSFSDRCGSCSHRADSECFCRLPHRNQ